MDNKSIKCLKILKIYSGMRCQVKIGIIWDCYVAYIYIYIYIYIERERERERERNREIERERTERTEKVINEEILEHIRRKGQL